MKSIIHLFFILLICTKVVAQGCSDAGACSLDFYYSQNETTDGIDYKNSLKFGNVVALGEQNTFINSNYLMLTRQVSKNFGAEIKITSAYINGELGSNFNVGDIFIKGSYFWKTILKTDISFLAAVKVPLKNGNFTKSGTSLPMVYQTSLGTYDFVFGYQTKWKRLEFFNLIQIPMTQNQNKFFASYSPNLLFPSTNQFTRKPDIIFSIAYNHFIEKAKILFGGQVLTIYHLGKDSFVDESNKRKDIDGSEGLTINLNAMIGYGINARNNLQLSAATPVLVRKERPDGLTRKFTAELNYQYSF